MKRFKFTTCRIPDEAIAAARKKNHHHRHSIGVIVVDPAGKHMVLAKPNSALANGAQVLVPPQERYPHSAELSVTLTVQQLVQSLLTYRVSSEQIQYLGHGFGNVHLTADATKRHSKYVHWFAHVVPNSERCRGFSGLLQDTPEFQEVQWLNFEQILSIHAGGTVSDEKLRMVMQALWVLCNRNRSLSETKAAQIAGRYLDADLIPDVA